MVGAPSQVFVHREAGRRRLQPRFPRPSPKFGSIFKMDFSQLSILNFYFFFLYKDITISLLSISSMI